MKAILFLVLALIYACGLIFSFVYIATAYFDWCYPKGRLGLALWMMVIPIFILFAIIVILGVGALLYTGFN